MLLTGYILAITERVNSPWRCDSGTDQTELCRYADVVISTHQTRVPALCNLLYLQMCKFLAVCYVKCHR